MAGDFGDAVSSGVAAAGTGAAIAGAGAAIGAAAGASLGPFAVIAAPIGAAIGALIGFFVALAKSDPPPTPEQIAAAKAAHEKAVQEAANTGPGLRAAVAGLDTAVGAWGVVSGSKAALQKAAESYLTGPATEGLRTLSAEHPQYAPMVDEMFSAVRTIAADWKNRATIIANLHKVTGVVQAIASMQQDLSDDPFAYLRPPVAPMFAAALNVVGLNVGDPAVLQIMRGKYNLGAAVAAVPRVNIGTIPIARASLAKASGGRVALDKRAFSAKLAPYGVVSYAIAPNTATQAWYKQEPYASNHGVPLTAPWPYGLDADRFALPPRPVVGAVAGLPTVVKVGVPVAAVVALLFFL